MKDGRRSFCNPGKKYQINAHIVIDATELGDVAKQVGIAYDIGMDSRSETGESIAPEQANDIIQDLTYTVILKDYGALVDATISQPDGYDPLPFFTTHFYDIQIKVVAGNGPVNHVVAIGQLPVFHHKITFP